MPNKKLKLVTHNTGFHADDIFATAVISLVLEQSGTEYEVIRTRDEETIKNADYVYDVGMVYDPGTNRFDHHQPGGAGKHDNGIEYASFGLVWKKFGGELCGGEEAAKIVEKKLVSPIDAGDNGMDLVDFKFDIFPYTIQNMIMSFYPRSSEENEENYMKGFLSCVAIAKPILKNEICFANDLLQARIYLQKLYDETTDKRILVLGEKYPWQDFVKNLPEPVFVVYPRIDGLWVAKAVSFKNSYKNKKDFPNSWAGLKDGELQNASGVSDAVFCHRALFLAAARSREGAMKLAQFALES